MSGLGAESSAQWFQKLFVVRRCSSWCGRFVLDTLRLRFYVRTPGSYCGYTDIFLHTSLGLGNLIRKLFVPKGAQHGHTQQIKQQPSWEQYQAFSSTHCIWELLISILYVSLIHRLTNSTAHWPANAVSTFCSVTQLRKANYANCYHNHNSLIYFRI